MRARVWAKDRVWWDEEEGKRRRIKRRSSQGTRDW